MTCGYDGCKQKKGRMYYIFCKGIFLEVEVAEGLLAKVQGN